MSEQRPCFGALQSETLLLVPVDKTSDVGLLEQLHSLDTAQACRMLGALLRLRTDKSGPDGCHDEIWLHSTEAIESLPASGDSSAMRARFWDKIDFIVMLRAIEDSEAADANATVELRIVVNSNERAPKGLLGEFRKFASAMSRLHRGSVFFMGVDDYILSEVSIAKKHFETKCDGYVMTLEEWQHAMRPVPFEETEVAASLGLEFSQLKVEELAAVREYNKIKYDLEYLEFCLPVSTCIRRKSDGKLVAWGLSHGDFEFGCMYTVEEYRRKGLAKYIVFDLGDRIVDAFVSSMRKLSTIDHKLNFTLQLAIEDYNEQSRRLFGSVGFKPTVRTNWAMCDVST
ncbi:hypothetical protein GGI12_001130 [Dipsacomyces acuminosporus]|nr:hypothetical protein GGI12_001130 [Dipsacomyces acuminosporus]